MGKEPRHLTNEQYLDAPLPFKIFSQRLNCLHELHWHEFYELTFIYSGRGTNIVNGVHRPLRKGSLFLLTPADFHEIFPEGGQVLQVHNVIFPEECFHEEQMRALFDNGSRLETVMETDEDFAAAAADFGCLWDEYNRQLPGCERMGRATLERILIRLARKCAADSPSPPLPADREFALHPNVHKALIHIRHHFREPITLESAAKQAGLAPNYFSVCFRRMTGVTFQRYLQEIRLGFARNLLKASQLPVTEICYASGFNSLPHFEKTFKRKYGVPPHACRKRKDQ